MEVEKLFDAIKKETELYVQTLEQFGPHSPHTKHACAVVYGMEKAFEVVAGVSYADYYLAKVTKSFEAIKELASICAKM